MDKLGDYLRNLRKEAKLSLKDVYRATGISDSKLNRIEHDKTTSKPSPDTLKALSTLYGVDPVELFIFAGFLDRNDLVTYGRAFKNVDLLTDEEKQGVQTQIDLLTKGRR